MYVWCPEVPPTPLKHLLLLGTSKLATVAAPDKWKEGARNTVGAFSTNVEKVVPSRHIYRFASDNRGQGAEGQRQQATAGQGQQQVRIGMNG